MFWLKACPRCHGDLYRRSDIYGPYIACLQCAHYLSEAEFAMLQRTSVSIVPQAHTQVRVVELAA